MSETATIEAVAKSVHDLSAAVKDMHAGMVDRETVDRIAADVVSLQNEHARSQKPTGIEPDDIGSESAWMSARTPAERLTALLERPAERIAPVARRSVADIEALQDRSDELLILSAAMGEPGRPADPRSLDFYGREYVPALQAALDSTTATEGDEWVPTVLSNRLIGRVNLPLKVADLFELIPMTSQPFELPAVGVSRVRTGIHTEQTADSGQTKFKAITPGTRKVTLTAFTFAGRMLVSKVAEEDAIVAMLPWMQRELLEFMAADIEDAIINGDTTGTHFDTGVSDADDVRKYWNGLRDIAINGQTGTDLNGSDTKLAVANLRANRKIMGKYGADPTKLAHVVSVRGSIDLLDDDDVVTLDKFGDNATIITGQIASVDGSPVVVSEYVSDFQNASGVFDNSTTTQTSAITVHRGGFIRGQRRDMTVQTLHEVYAEADQDAIIASLRQAFTPLYPLTENIVALTYNLPGSA